METFIMELKEINPRRATLIEGLPGLGLIGKIVTAYLVEELEAEKFAELYSPYLPFHVVVDDAGSARLVRLEFYYWRNEKGGGDLIIVTGDSQSQMLRGQYELAEKIVDYAVKLNVERIITVGGYSADSGGANPDVACVSIDQALLDELVNSGAHPSPEGNPIVGVAGLILGLAKFRDIDAACLLGRTLGHMPDPRAAMRIMTVLNVFLDLQVDLRGLEEQVKASEMVLERLEGIQRKMEMFEERRRRRHSERLKYIS